MKSLRAKILKLPYISLVLAISILLPNYVIGSERVINKLATPSPFPQNATSRKILFADLTGPEHNAGRLFANDLGRQGLNIIYQPIGNSFYALHHILEQARITQVDAIHIHTANARDLRLVNKLRELFSKNKINTPVFFTENETPIEATVQYNEEQEPEGLANSEWKPLAREYDPFSAKCYTICGAGPMGEAVAFDLAQLPDTAKIYLVDQYNQEQGQALVEKIRRSLRNPACVVAFIKADLKQPDDLISIFAKSNVVIGAAHYTLNEKLSRLAVENGASWVDMGGNTGVVLRQQANAQTAIKNKCAMAPDNGLAPGMACNILAVDGINKLVGDNYEVDDVVIRVGGLPLSDWDLQQLLQKEADPVAQKELEALLEDTDRRFFSPLKYLLVFSIWGLINEYMGHSLAIRDGKIVAIPTMAEEEREPVIIDLEDPEVYEAILTSGGISLIPYAYRGIVKNMIYETIRYAGHGPIIKAFIEMGFFAEEELAKVHIGEKGKIVPAQFFRQLYSPELLDQDNVQSAAQYLGLLNTEEITVTPDEDGYITPREVFAQIAQSILHNPQEKDKILIQVEVTGHRDGKMKRLTYNYNTLNAGSYGKEFSEMGRLTAFPVAILAMMMARGEFPYAGAGGIEKIVDTEKFIQYMQERGINIQVTVDEEINNHTAATAADLAQKIRAQTQPATPASESPPTPFTHSV